ncbi:MAG TPA: hypothetical protein VFS42_00255 [Burkholderiaceae bacterium]|nr:hypothetical protein [Burkholderiaceae bacterium]
MATVLRAAGLAALVIALVWAMVIVAWQQSNHSPTQSDLLVYLVLVPTALLAAIASIRAVVRWNTKRAEAKEAARADATKQNGETTDATPAPKRIALLGASIVSPLGDEPKTLLDALAESPAPKLDEQLQRDDGSPIFAARVATVDEHADAHALPATLSNDAKRPTALGLRAFDGLAKTLAAYAPNPSGNTSSPTRLRITWLFNEEVLSADCDALLRTLVARLKTLGWPAEQVVHTGLPARDARDAITAIEQAFVALQKDTPRDLHLIGACDSFITNACVETLQRDRRLFGDDCPAGLIPGEAAAAILLGPAALLENPPAPYVFVHQPFNAQREQAIDDVKRVTAAELSTLIEKTVADSGEAPAKLGLVVTDIDHRPAANAELAQAVGERFEHLDPVADAFSVGRATGHAGAATTLVTLAVAHAAVLERQASVLFVSAQGAIERTAFVVTNPIRS